MMTTDSSTATIAAVDLKIGDFMYSERVDKYCEIVNRWDGKNGRVTLVLDEGFMTSAGEKVLSPFIVKAQSRFRAWAS